MIWATYANGIPIFPGDWVRVYVPRLGVWHHGIVHLLIPNWNGIAVQIIHNDKTYGVSLIDWHDFADGSLILLHKRPTPNQVPIVVARAGANLGKAYHLFARNCEHFASFAFTGQAKSESIQVLGAFAAMVCVIGYFGSDHA